LINNKTIAVVVPCFNEESQIGMVIKTMPDFVDRIVIVNDKSNDKTVDNVISYINDENYNSTSEVIRDKTKGDFIETDYNYADKVVFNQNIKEKKYFNPSEVVNSNSE
jgi:glycosyltransferase involved in cell wall biosynthesis